MKPILILALITLAAATKWFQLTRDYDFETYKAEFGKSYEADEEQIRRSIFERNLNKILTHNGDPSASYRLGVNGMTDWTDQEFRRLLGYKRGADSHLEKPRDVEREIDVRALPVHVDWRSKGIISAVKDQGQCGSCWTFGTAETIESHWALKTGQLQALSEQQILDCVPNPNQCGGTGGCGGGTPELAMAKIIELGGLTSEWTYPYRSYDGSANPSCTFNTGYKKSFVQLSGYKVLTSNSKAAVMDAVAKIGPLAVNVDASAWQFYESGVFNGCNQTTPILDHVVQLVGYGTDPKNGDYWIVRNSWNPTWGEEGYIRLARPAETPCGWDTNPSQGTGCQGGPDRKSVV